MKFCRHCGKELIDEAIFCPECGKSVDEFAPKEEKNDAPVIASAVADNSPAYTAMPNLEAQKSNEPKQISGLKKAAKALMIVGTIIMSLCCYIIPLAWCLPMTLSYCKKIKNGEPISTKFKVCSLLFVSTVAGILMLCDHDD